MFVRHLQQTMHLPSYCTACSACVQCGHRVRLQVPPCCTKLRLRSWSSNMTSSSVALHVVAMGCSKTGLFVLSQVMPPISTSYQHRCAACGTSNFRGRPQARALVDAVPEKKHLAVYPHLSDDNNRICDACYFSIRRDYPAQPVTPAAAIASHTQDMVSSAIASQLAWRQLSARKTAYSKIC